MAVLSALLTEVGVLDRAGLTRRLGVNGAGAGIEVALSALFPKTF